MRSLATYYFSKVEKEYLEWKSGSQGNGVPGRLILREFDPEIVKSILEKLATSSLPIAPPGSSTGFIVAVEDHEHYEEIDVKKFSFADLTYERNREGDFFCLMFIADTKPTHDQVTRIDQSIVFEPSETLKLVNIAKSLQANSESFVDEYVEMLGQFIRELTDPKWASRPFIGIEKITLFIDHVIIDTIDDGMFWSAIGRNCIRLGGINRLDEFQVLNGVGKDFRKTFRKMVSSTLFSDIDFWRAIHKNKEIDFNDIESNLATIIEETPENRKFCEQVKEYFKAYFNGSQNVSQLKTKLQLDFDCQYPYSSVLQKKKTKTKFNLGEETLLFLSDNDVDVPGVDLELISLIDDKQAKPEKNELRRIYFTYAKNLMENSKLDKAWLKEISTSKTVEGSDLIAGLLSVLSKSIFLMDIGDDKVMLQLAKDRTKRSLLKKNKSALKFFFCEYKDLDEYWSLFGDNFKLDLPNAFSKDSLLAEKELKERSGKSANELHFRVLRYSENPKSPSESWDFKWRFNSAAFESVKHIDFEKVLSREGYYYKHNLSIDPLLIKHSGASPTIANRNVFQAVSSNMRRGLVVKKQDKELTVVPDSLKKLLEHNYITREEYKEAYGCYEEFTISWREAVQRVMAQPLFVELSDFKERLEKVVEVFSSLESAGENSRNLLYDFLLAHTLTVDENDDYAVFLPWSPYAMLITAEKNKVYRNIADAFKRGGLLIGNKDDGVLSKLLLEFASSFGKGLFLKRSTSSKWNDLICSQSRFGYFEYTPISNSKNAIDLKEVRSIVRATAVKFLETFPNERHHLEILCDGLLSYEHIQAVYDELLALSDDLEDQASISIVFTCKDRSTLDAMYQQVCENFDANKIDSNISVRFVNDLSEVGDGEVDLFFSFDPLFTTNVKSTESPQSVVSESPSVFWEYCASRKVPADPISKKSLFALNNHIQDPVGALFHRAFMRCSGNNSEASFCREVAQSGLKSKISEGLLKSNWLIVYDYLISKEALDLGDNIEAPGKRVLRYVQGEGLKRSLAIITDKETHYITANLESSLREWKLVHPENLRQVVDRIFDLSNSFSSDVLLRSVGNGSFSHDLVGTVGATTLIDSIFDKEQKVAPIFWVHLDDYIGWFKSSIEDDALKSIGRAVNYVSDLLGIYLSGEGDNITLNLIVCESKLVNGGVEQQVKSCKQLKATCDLIQSMLQTSESFDFGYWINKFFEFIIGNFKFNPNQFDFSKLLKLDKSQIAINLYGLSIVFHYGNDVVETSSDRIYETSHLRQVLLSFDDTKKVFRDLLNNSGELLSDTPLHIEPLKLNDKRLVSDYDSSGTFGDLMSELGLDSSTKKSEPTQVGTDSMASFSSGPDSNEPVNEDTSLGKLDEGFDQGLLGELGVGDTPHVVGEVAEPKSINECSMAACPNDSVNKQIDQNQKSVLGLVKDCIEFLDVEEQLPDEINVEQIKEGIRTIFRYAQLPSSFADAVVTPNSIVIKLRGHVSLSASKILKLKGTFLSVVGLSLRQVYPEPGVMVLVFDRDKRQTVHFGRLLKKTYNQRRDDFSKGFNSKVLIGQNEFGEDCCFFKLDGASPHALIGGQTKSGKSILMNNMITDLIMTNTPENLKLRLFDPKQVEFSSYSRSSHLAHPVVLDKDTAVVRLQEAETLMNERYVTLKDMGLKDFESYNRRHPENRMSRQVIFFDELADWILDSDFKKEANDIIVRLSSKGRAAGVHLVLATQRPSNDVVFPLLRANLDTKIALKVDRDLNSEIILGEPGAENLLGYGHGIVKSEGEKTYVQVGFTESQKFEELIELIINYWKNN